jgi:hypothetical protein
MEIGWKLAWLSQSFSTIRPSDYSQPNGPPGPARHGPVMAQPNYGMARYGMTTLTGRAGPPDVPRHQPRHGTRVASSCRAGPMSPTGCGGLLSAGRAERAAARQLTGVEVEEEGRSGGRRSEDTVREAGSAACEAEKGPREAGEWRDGRQAERWPQEAAAVAGERRRAAGGQSDGWRSCAGGWSNSPTGGEQVESGGVGRGMKGSGRRPSR